MKKYFLLQLLMTCCCFVWIACDKENPEPDPIIVDKDPFSADFIIAENVGDSLVATDSTLLYNLVTFEPIGIYDTYQWTIGEDERTFTDSTLTLRFIEASDGPILVRLIAKGKTNPLLPEDDGIDTVEHIFYVIPWSEAPIIGKYQGAFASQPEDKTQIVEIRYISPEEDPNTEPYGSFELINIDKGCNTLPKVNNASVWNYINRGAKALEFDAYKNTSNYFNNCKAPNAWLYMQGTDTLKVDFTYGEETGSATRFEDQFLGVRIN